MEWRAFSLYYNDSVCVLPYIIEHTVIKGKDGALSFLSILQLMLCKADLTVKFATIHPKYIFF